MKRICDFERSSRKDCCGCGTCALACPTDAIRMKPMELGSAYPVVDPDKCIDCGLCTQVCVFQQEKIAAGAPVQAYAAAAGDDSVLFRSASGGVFAAVAGKFILSGGVVCGCSLENREEGLEPVHICVDTLPGIQKLQGSKYVQSTLGNIFDQIKVLLRNGTPVLFSGTPCQADSLRYYLKNEDTSKLYIIDLVCHGVPGTNLFQDYLRSMKKPITAFAFRDKENGWGLNASYIYECDNKQYKVLLPSCLSSYYSYFLESEIYRESCYNCRYADRKRVGDLTLGDFWGIELEHPEYLQENGGAFSLQKGVSAILVNTRKGQELLDQFGSDLHLSETDLDRIIRWNRQLNQPSIHSEKRADLADRYTRFGYKGIEAKWRKELGLRYFTRAFKFLLKSAGPGFRDR